MKTKTITPNYEAAFTVKAEDVEPEYTLGPAAAELPNYRVQVHTENQDGLAEKMADCLNQAIKQICGFCLLLNGVGVENAGEVCPFDMPMPCDQMRWKEILKAYWKENEVDDAR